MTDKARYYLAHKDEQKHPGDHAPPAADAIRIIDCEDPDCFAVHILLLDPAGDGIAQATINLDMVMRMYAIIRKKLSNV